MGMAIDEIIGVAQVQARPGIPYGQALGGVVVPLQSRQRASDAYASYEAMAAEVAATMDRRYPDLDEALRRIYRNESGAWVRVVGEHTGETFVEKDPQGRVLGTFAARVWIERAVGLDKAACRENTEIEMDWFQAGKGWIRRGVKREWEDELNLGNQARQKVQWERIHNTSPSPSADRPTTMPLQQRATLPTQLSEDESARLDPEAFADPPAPVQQPLRREK